VRFAAVLVGFFIAGMIDGGGKEEVVETVLLLIDFGLLLLIVKLIEHEQKRSDSEDTHDDSPCQVSGGMGPDLGSDA
jgi:hypothetical protein